MKADSCGTYTEQLRYKMGWKAPRQVRDDCADAVAQWNAARPKD